MYKPLVIDSEQLCKIHRVQLDISLEIKRICELNSFNYFIIAGTLLGAVRHKGFIPWDEDIDIGMLRKDYDKFIEVAKKDLSSEYFLQTWYTDPGYGLPLAKITKKGTKLIEMNTLNVKSNKGIFVDIFPFDSVPDQRYKKNIQDLKTKVLRRMLLLKLGYKLKDAGNSKEKIIIKGFQFIASKQSSKKLKFKLEKEMKKYNQVKTYEIVTFGGSYGYKKETIKREWAESLTTIGFEGEEFSCMKEYKKYLTYFYGDFMTPPPVEKRNNRHGIVEIDFGEEK